MAKPHIEGLSHVEQLFVELLEDRAKLMAQNELLWQRKANVGGNVVAAAVQQVVVLPKFLNEKKLEQIINSRKWGSCGKKSCQLRQDHYTRGCH